MGRPLIICSPFNPTSGYGRHGTEIRRALDNRGIAVNFVSRGTRFDPLDLPRSSSVVLHVCGPSQVRIAEGKLNVNYTTFEATQIPENWVKHNLRHDLVILPSESSKQAWMASGIPEDQIRLCPLGVDPDRFHPGVEPLQLGSRRGRKVCEYRTRFLNISAFIAVPRKNILGLLRVWLKATNANDDAVLILKLGGYGYRWWWPDRFNRALHAIERDIGKSRRKAAPILFYDEVLTESQMPSLYSAATHYWSMSYGEGWDLPMTEAGAMDLHLIAPEHSAYTAYLDDSVAQMIPSKRVPAVPADLRGCWGFLEKLFAGSEWWQPDEEAAAEFIRQAIETGGDSLPTARARLTSEFTWEQSAKRLIKILEELHERHGKTF
jgi:glycosyltransferase involved in cell wall biosynthesis